MNIFPCVCSPSPVLFSLSVNTSMSVTRDNTHYFASYSNSDCCQVYCCLNYIPLIREIEQRELNGGNISMFGGLPKDGSYTLGADMSR